MSSVLQQIDCKNHKQKVSDLIFLNKVTWQVVETLTSFAVVHTPLLLNIKK